MKRDIQRDLELLAAAFFEHLEIDEVEFGGIGLDSKRPFGNSNVEQDILEIIGWDKEGDDGDGPCYAPIQREYARMLYYESLIPFLREQWALAQSGCRCDSRSATDAKTSSNRMGHPFVGNSNNITCPKCSYIVDISMKQAVDPEGLRETISDALDVYLTTSWRDEYCSFSIKSVKAVRQAGEEIDNQQIRDAILRLTPEERLEILHDFCRDCGSNNPGCQCSNDS